MTFPLTRVYEMDTKAAAAGADAHFVVGVAAEAETITAVEYLPNADVTGDDTETRTLTLFNRGTAGLGTTSLATLALVTGVDMVGYDAKALTLTATVADRDITAGQVIELFSEHSGETGLADPGGKVRVLTVRTDSAGN